MRKEDNTMHAYQHPDPADTELADTGPPATVGEAHPDPQPHAQPRPLRAVPEGVSAGAGAPARARITDEINLNSQPDPQPVPQPPATADSDQQSAAEVSQRPATEVRDDPQTAAEESQPSTWERVKQWAHPPNVRTWMPPTWDQIQWRGERGEHVSREGWPRTGAQAWAWFHQQIVRRVLACTDWVFGSFSRFVVVAVLYTLLAHLTWLSWLPWPGFLP